MDYQCKIKPRPSGRVHTTPGLSWVRAICLGVCLLLSLSARVCVAEEEKLADVRVLIDVSGSMKQNDPNNLRVPAIELLCRLMPKGSRAGIWFFAQGVNPVVKVSTVDAAWKQNAIRLSKTIHSQGLLTDIGAALEKASQEPSPPGFQKHIILLTDGMVDIGQDAEKNQALWRKISGELLTKLKANGDRIHTIALSANADKNLLEKLSVGTDAASVVALTADQLVPAFLQVFDTAAPQPQLPIEGNHFDVDKSIEEITALIFRGDVAGQITLSDPQGQTFNATNAPKNVNWYRADNYDLITLNKPAVGKWTLDGSIAAGSRLTLVSDLKLAVEPLPNNIFIGEGQDLSLQLQESGKTFINPEFLKLIHFSAEIISADGKSDTPIWSRDLTVAQPPADGIFHSLVPSMSKEGVVSLSLIADGKTFKREYRQRISVRERFRAEVEAISDNGYEIVVKTYDESIDKNSVTFLAQLEDAEHTKQPVNLAITPVDTWVGAVELTKPGAYLLKISVKATDKNGASVLHEITPVTIEHQLDKVAPPPPIHEAAPHEAAPPEPPAVEHPPAPEPPAEGGLPSWAFYSLLGLGNLALIGFIYFLYKKFFGSKSEEEILSEFALEPVPAPPKAKKQTPLPAPPMEEYDETQMQIPGVEDEIPPMEDLDPDSESDSDLASNNADEIASELSDVDIDALFAEQAQSSAPKKEEADDMVQAMLRAQGLDLAEDEMDDAISSLIDELDSAESKTDYSPASTSTDDDGADDFGFDFDEKT